MGIGVGSEVGEREREREQSKTRGRHRGEVREDRGALGEVGILWENLPWGWRLILAWGGYWKGRIEDTETEGD